MKSLFACLTLAFILFSGCDDSESPKFSARILQDYNWQFVSGTDGRLVAVIGQPFPYLNQPTTVISFSGTSSGTYFNVGIYGNTELGQWKIIGDKLTLGGSSATIRKLTKQQLVYTNDAGITFTWMAMDK